MTDAIRVETSDYIRTIRFNRPDKKNAITRPMYTAMAEALEDANANREVRVVVLAGSEGVFTAGNDLVDFIEAPPHIGGGDMPPVERFMRALMDCEKPVIAAVDGLAIGIGTTLLLHCDLAYASDRAVFKTPFVDLALAPEFGSSQILPGLVGRAVAGELLLLGESWDAAKAMSRHLVADVFPAGRLEEEVTHRARTLAAKAPGAVRAAKALMTRPGEPLVERIVREGGIFADLLRSEEFKEAVTAFMERRKPDFSKFG
ncbi:enoyl-CoA hydratase [Marinicauda algicola]|uniref:Enoyl-CoA hydratase n=1 Tax=Marinicauda algicola TaxID=2029849 RepID=A0A4S2H2H8_9PROT|nr:enoyl-CoA hydratase [Marinicauda algicola]TGY89734.1 enoyl-CoA hydratase [Marinicauda algicola]